MTDTFAEQPFAEQQSDFIPLGLYRNKNTHKGYIGFPEKIRKDDKTVLEFPEIQGMEFQEIFYALNPGITPVPWGTTLLCAEKALTSELETNSIVDLYDHFDIDTRPNCLRFLAWLRPIGNASPLYISYDYRMSFNKEDIVGEQMPLSPIYVFRKKPTGFINSHNHCVPVLNGGIDIHDCTMLYTKDITRNENIQPNTFPVLYQLHQLYHNTTQVFFNPVISVLLVCLFLIFVVKKVKRV